MKYYYKEHIDKLEACPPSEYNTKKCECYRWVFDDISDNRNFLAQADKNPKTLNSKSDFDKCENYALSFHDTLENSQLHFSKLTNRFKNLKKLLGTHIAKGRLEDMDGIGSKNDKIGHFNFHHTNNCNFNQKFKIICNLQ